MNDLLPEWVYLNLSKFKNCSIGLKTYKKLGEENILEDLRNHGLNCKIRIHKFEDIYENQYRVRPRKETYIIIEVI